MNKEQQRAIDNYISQTEDDLARAKHQETKTGSNDELKRYINQCEHRLQKLREPVV